MRVPPLLLLIAFLVVVISCCCSLVRSVLGPPALPFDIDTLVGQRFYDGEGGLASHVSISYPFGVAVQPGTQDLFIVDSYNHVIRRVDNATGTITTVVGIPEIGGYDGDDYLATEALLNYPRTVTFSPDGQSMYIVDTNNHRVRLVKDGIITTVAGTGVTGYGGDGGLATNAPLNSPSDIAILPSGDLLISDTNNHRIRKVDHTSGIITTIAGTGTRTGDAGAPLGDNGPATSATLFNPSGIVVTSNGDIVFADRGNYRIRKIGADGKITTIVGTGTSGVNGNNGPATDAQIGYIGGLGLNSGGDLFLTENFNHCIRKVDITTQIITIVAGICSAPNGGYLGDNVLATTTRLNAPSSVAIKSNGEIVIADTNNHRIRVVKTNGIINTIAGKGVPGFSGDSGIAIDSLLDTPTSVAVTNNGEVVISDYGNRKLRKVDRNGIITALAGRGAGYGGDGESALNALLNNGGEVVVTDTGDVLFADTGNNRIRKVDSSGTIMTIAGSASIGFGGDGGPATAARLNQPRSVAYLNGEVYIADTNNHRIRKIFPNGTITTIAGDGTADYCGDDGPAVDACLDGPVSVVVNNAGEVFISDEHNQVVRKIDSRGIITTFAGIPGSNGYTGDGDLATNAKLSYPRGLAINKEGELFIADRANYAIRKVDNSGTISTVVTGLSNPADVSVGRDGELFIIESTFSNQVTMVDNNGLAMAFAGSYDTGSSISDFYLPENAPLVFASSVSVLSDNILIVADTYNNKIKKVDINTKAISSFTFGPPLSHPRGAIVVNDEVYFADYGNHCIQKIDSNGTISDVVGVCRNGGYSSDGTPKNITQLYYPSGVAVASNGDMFIADSGNHVIRKVSSGRIRTIAGIVGQAKVSSNNVLALSAHLYEPTDLTIAPNGELYISDHGNHCIRKIDENDNIQIVAGQCGNSGFSGDDGLATNAQLYHPRGLTFTRAGDLLIADSGNSVIRKVDIGTGIIMSVAGVGEGIGYGGDGGPSNYARLTRPTGIAASSSGDFYIADFGNHLIRVVQPTHTCDGIFNKNSTVCSGNGFCVTSDICRCHRGYSGPDCSIVNCFGIWSNESSVCSDHGKCTALDTCECKLGYIGNNCSVVTPTGGSLQVSPSSGGTLLITKFNLTTSGWVPIEQATTFEYRFSVVDPSTNESLFLNSFSTSPTLMTTLPFRGVVTVVVECRSASGYSQQQNASIIVGQPTAQDLFNYVTVSNETLLAVSSAEFETELTIVCSAIPSIVETLDSYQVSSLITNLVDTMTTRKGDLSVEKKVQNSKLLSNEVKLFDKYSVLKLSHLLTDTMREQSESHHHVLNDAISATKNFATVMISEKSEKDEKVAFLDLLDQVSMRKRSELKEGEQAQLSMQHLEVVMAKTSAQYPNTSLVIPQQERGNVLLQVKTSSLSTHFSSIDVQGQILEHPTETYVTKCDTTLVSPTISVRLFDPTKHELLPELDNYDFTEPIIATTIDVFKSMKDDQTGDSFAFVCKYHVTSNDTWTMDDRVCRTSVSPHDSSSVICMCNQPVTHAVSLDYIQSTIGEEKNGRGNSDDAIPCTNPCGCAPQSAKSHKLQSWAKVLIGISVSLVAIVIVIFLVAIGLVIVKKVLLKRSPSDPAVEKGTEAQERGKVSEEGAG